MSHEVYFLRDENVMIEFQVNERLKKYDKVICMCLWGGLVAVGTHLGHLMIFHCPSNKRLSYINNYRPLFNKKICQEAIIKVDVNDDGHSPVVAAATKDMVVVLKWSPKG